MDELGRAVHEIWSVRDPDPDSPWLAGLGSSDVRRVLLRKVCSRVLGIPAPGVAGVLEQQDRGLIGFDPGADPQRLRAWFRQDGWPVVERLCTVAGALKRTAVEALRPTPARVRGRDVALWALGVVGRRYWDDGVEPTVRELADDVAAYVSFRAAEGPLQDLRMPEAEFVEAVQAEWDIRWPADRPPVGIAPSTLGLGHDRRPCLGGWRGDWKSGTDRSVYSRYRRYFDASSRSGLFDTEELDPGHHVTRRHLGGTKLDVATTELDRVCRPLGLATTVHVDTVVAVARGLGPATDRVASDMTLDGWAAAGLPPGDELSAAVARWTADWIANNALAARLNSGGPQLVRGVVRRLWHYLHGREVEWESALNRVDTIRLIKMCFGRHLWDLPPELDPDSKPHADREQATVNLINEHPGGPALVRRVLARDPGWPAAYREIVPDDPRYLAVDEFQAFCDGFADPGES